MVSGVAEIRMIQDEADESFYESLLEGLQDSVRVKSTQGKYVLSGNHSVLIYPLIVC